MAIGQPKARVLHIPSRDELIHKAKDRLLRRGLPRLQMSGLLALTGAAGFLSSFLLLQLGVGSMALRYPVAVGLAYGVFLLLLRVWLDIQRRGWLDVASDQGPDVLDASFDAVLDAADSHALEVPSGGGASFGGGGKGSGFDFSFDLDDSGFFVLLAVLIAAVAAVGAALWILWIAPALLAEVLVDGLVMTALYKRLKQPQPTYWLASAVRRTWIPTLAVALLLSVAGWLLQRAEPDARSLGAAWKAATTSESETRP
jgi:hypothetical protein